MISDAVAGVGVLLPGEARRVAASGYFGGPAGGRCDVSTALALALRSGSKSANPNGCSVILASVETSKGASA